MLRKAGPGRILIAVGVLSAAMYGFALVHGPFREHRLEPFFAIFGAVFVLYAIACVAALSPRLPERRALVLIFAFAALFSLLLLLTPPSLSDDMFRYVWDGRVQAHGFNPYRYASNAPELASLRDAPIWTHMNRIQAVTIYPPFAQLAFAVTWRLVGDSVLGFKVMLVLAAFAAAGLLALLLHRLGDNPARVVIFLWNPLLLFEIAHAGHVDALSLPLIVGAMLLRVRAPRDAVDGRVEAAIGVLLGLATLTKLYPAFLAAPLWSMRGAEGRRRWRWALPASMIGVIGLGYLLYSAPGVNTLGFLAMYNREAFNTSPGVWWLIDAGLRLRMPWYQTVTLTMAAAMVLSSLTFALFPARTPRQAVLRCAWPIGAYILFNANLFSWYVLWMLPLVAITFRPWRPNAALAWWAFSGLVVLSYTFFLAWERVTWAINLQFYALYTLLLVALVYRVVSRRRREHLAWRAAH